MHEFGLAIVDNRANNLESVLIKRLLTTAAVASALAFTATTARAITTLYSGNVGGVEQTNFLAAAGGGLSFESFEGITPNGAPVPSIDFGAFEMADNFGGTFANDLRTCPAGFCAAFTTATDGTNFIHASGSTTYTFDDAINAFSFTLSHHNVVDSLSITTNAGDVLSGLGTPNFGTGASFFGIINDTATFTEVTVTYGRDDDSVGIDEIRFGELASTIPEPGTIAIFGLSLLGLAGIRRHRRA
ncbi:MAG: hypothetical protein CMM52_01460 [Rhodospirillaceae bacterium]|nr:hypothetical protein [Rhodospirillaceae bacterium]